MSSNWHSELEWEELRSEIRTLKYKADMQQQLVDKLTKALKLQQSQTDQLWLAIAVLREEMQPPPQPTVDSAQEGKGNDDSG